MLSGHALDISSVESVQAMVNLIDERYGRLDILVNNATGATRSPAPVSATDLASAQEIVEVTLFGTWRLIQATLPLLQKKRSGQSG